MAFEYPAASAEPHLQGARRRPATVTCAVVLQLVLVLTGLVMAIMAYAVESTVRHLQWEAAVAAGASPDVQSSAELTGRIVGGATIWACPGLFGAAILIALAVLNLRGNNIARIVSWVLSGLSVLGVLCLNVSRTSSLRASTAGSRGVAVDYPVWIPLYSLASIVLVVVLSLAVALLLALPASNRFFARR